MLKDKETLAMRTIALLMAPLFEAEQDRVARWVYDRYVLARVKLAQEETPARSER